MVDIKNITISVIPYGDMRYKTVGDYFEKNEGHYEIQVADTGNAIYNQLVMVHELIELLLVLDRGISIADIDRFDIAFENARTAGEVDGEPGDDEKAPYRKEHRFSTKIEMLMAKRLKVVWDDYEDALGDTSG